MADLYFKRVLIKDSLVKLQKDVAKTMDLARDAVVKSQCDYPIIAGNINRAASIVEEDFKNLSDLIDDLLEEIEMK